MSLMCGMHIGAGGYIDHAGKWNPAFTGHSYVRIREFETGRLVANVTETISTSFVSAFVDHTEAGDVSASNKSPSQALCLFVPWPHPPVPVTKFRSDADVCEPRPSWRK